MRFLLTLSLLTTCMFTANPAVPCTLHDETPEAFTLATPDAEFVVAIVRPWGHLSAAEAAIIQRYERSGVYSAESVPELLWALPITDGAATVRSFFNQSGRVYLVVSLGRRLLFYVDGTLTRELEESDFLSAPWRTGSDCGFGADDIEIDGTSLGATPTVAVTTSEGSQFVFDARTAQLLAEDRPPALRAVAPNAEERRLTQVVSDFSALGEAGNVGAFVHELGNLFADVILKSCYPESIDKGRFQAEGPTVDPEASVVLREFWHRVRPVHSDVLGLERLRTPDSDFAFYRVPEGEAMRTLCGIRPLPTKLLAASLADHGASQEVLEKLAAGLNGPTVISAFFAELPDGDDECRLVGVAVLWSRVSDQWKVIAFNPFVRQAAPSEHE